MTAAAWTIFAIAIAVALVLAVRWELRSRSTGVATSSGVATPGVGDPGERHEFMSQPWIAMARREITAALADRDLGDRSFTLSEEFTDAPAHLRQGPDPIGFCVRIEPGHAEVGDHPGRAADLRVISDDGDALTLARDPGAASADPAEASHRMAEGRLRIVGDPASMPVALRTLDIHGLLANRPA